MVGTSRRCRSVPPTVVEVNYDYGVGSRKAQRIANYLADDHDSLRAASRRQDAALLRDITSRMDASCEYRRPVHVTRRARARSPVTCNATRSRRANSVPPCFRTVEYDEDLYLPFVPRSRARIIAEDYEPYFYKPITSYVSHQVRHRAGSEPPVDRTLRNMYTSPAQRYTTPSTDLAVRQAHGALGRLERELSTGWEDPYYYEYADEYVHSPVRPYRQAAYAGVTNVPTRSYSPTRTYSPSIQRRSRAADVEARLESMMAPDPVSMYAGLRSRTAEARSKMDTHKVMLDRYLPIYLGPEREVGMPDYERYRPSTQPSKVAPYRPTERRMSLPSTPTRVVAPSPPQRPPMSDARKRAREVLCKTKHDPEYFSY